jgi:hypothetical protein
MIRAIGTKRLDLSEDEFAAYNKIIEVVDPTEFNGVFKTDLNGEIQYVIPPINKNVSMIVVFFLFNVMINQRLRKIDNFVSDYSETKQKLKEKGLL